MELNIKERIVLLNIIPKEGDFKTLKQLRKFREDLGFTDSEQTILKFNSPGDGTINWEEPVDGESYISDIEMSESVHALIVDVLIQADKEKKLNEDTFTLYERFVDNAKDAQ